MIKFLFGLYRRAPFRARNLLGRVGRLIGFFMRPVSVVRMGEYRMALDFSDNASFKYLADRESFEAVEMGLFRDAINWMTTCLVVDVGANYGAYTLSAAHIASKSEGAVRVVSVEPDRRAFRALKRSLSINGFDSVCDPFQVIAGDTAGVTDLWVNARSSADNRTHRVSTSAIPVRERYAVPVATLDSIIESAPVECSRHLVVKMDIQGNEPRAFRGLEGSLRAAARWCVLFEHAPYLIESAGLDLEEFVSWVARLSFDEAFEITRAGKIEKYENREAFYGTLSSVPFDPDYRGEGSVTNFLLRRGMEGLVLPASDSLHHRDPSTP